MLFVLGERLNYCQSSCWAIMRMHTHIYTHTHTLGHLIAVGFRWKESSSPLPKPLAELQDLSDSRSWMMQTEDERMSFGDCNVLEQAVSAAAALAVHVSTWRVAGFGLQRSGSKPCIRWRAVRLLFGISIPRHDNGLNLNSNTAQESWCTDRTQLCNSLKTHVLKWQRG